MSARAGRPQGAGQTLARVAWVIVGATFVVTLVVGSRGWWFLDDFGLLSAAAHEPWLSPELLGQSWGGHFMPGGFLIAQLIGKTSGYAYATAMVTLAAGSALLVLVVHRVLSRHLGTRPGTVAVVFLVATSATVLQASAWWAAALNALPLLVCTTLAVDRLLRLCARPSAGSVAWVVGLCAAALMFFEKAVLLPLVLGGVAVAFAEQARLRDAVRTTVVRLWPLWASLLVMEVAYGLVYLSSRTPDGFLVGGGTLAPPNVALLIDQLVTGVGTTATALLLGGWATWTGVLAGYGEVTLPTVLRLLGLQAGIAAVVACSALSQRARRLLATVGLYAVASALLVNMGRQAFLAYTVSLPRYFADVTLLFLLALPLGMLPLVRDGRSPVRLPRWIRPSATWRTAGRAMAILAANAVLIGFVLTASGLAAGIGYTPSRSYIETTSAELTSLGPDEEMLDLPVPRDVLPLPLDRDTYAWAFAPVRGSARFVNYVSDLRVIDREGRIQPGAVVGPSSVPAPPGSCGWTVLQGEVSVPLDAEVITYPHEARVDYEAARAGSVVVHLGGGAPATIGLLPGRQSVYFRLAGGGGQVTFSDVRGEPGLCVHSVTVGAAGPRSDPPK